jgi:MFS family permease
MALTPRSTGHDKDNTPPINRAFFYGWVIVAMCTIMQIMQSGIVYTFGIFFKPLIADFGWSRAATSGVYSLFQISAGIAAIPMGWLADRFGPARIAVLSGFMMGLGLMLTSQISQLWHLYITYGVIVGIGISGTFSICTGVTARWFIRKRGLALGIVSSGVGLGTLIMSPVAERLITVSGWSNAYVIISLVTWVVIMTSALFLRSDPGRIGGRPYGAEESFNQNISTKHENVTKYATTETGITLAAALHNRPLWILISLFFFFGFGVQLVQVHFVNYATDKGITSFVAATFLSLIGVCSVVGRLASGAMSDRIGHMKALIICCAIFTVSLIWLTFADQLWMFYIFATLFGFSYGGEVPLMPLLIGRYFGLRAVMALVGVMMASSRAGGALGAWTGGVIYDASNSYMIAFIIAAITGLSSLLLIPMLRRIKSRNYDL